jgi:predicted DNA-binding ribbon-helix-helix protein
MQFFPRCELSLKDFLFSWPPANPEVAAMTVSRLVNRNVVAERGRTSMRLEPELWDMLNEVCEREAQDMSTLVRQIEAAGHSGGRTSAVRVFIASYFKAAATEVGHASAGHGPLQRRTSPELARSAA